MNLKEIHTPEKEVSAKSLSDAIQTKVLVIQILKDGLLKEHITKTPAVLVCVQGEVSFEDENGNQIILKPGDFHEIQPMLKHWVKGNADSQLILTK